VRSRPAAELSARPLNSNVGAGLWFLLDLDDPFEYQMKVGDAFRFRLTRINAFLVRSRWEGKDVGAPEGTSVFILLVEEARHPTTDMVDPAAYVHIAWGMCSPLLTA
jgi:hypothetical protein